MYRTNRKCRFVYNCKTLCYCYNAILTGELKNPSLEEYHNIIEKIYERYDRKRKPKKQQKGLFFRGHRKSEYKLAPTVFRNGRAEHEHEFLLNYRDNLVRVRPHQSFDFIKNRLEILAEMQHYFLPTRLLDWSFSPLVALYFALEENEKNKEVEGVVWVLNPWRYCDKLLNYGPPPRHWFEMNKLGRALLSTYDEFAVREILRKEFYGNSLGCDLEEPFPFVPRYQNPRMVQQGSAFTIHGNRQEPIEEFPNHQKYLTKIIIRPALKQKLREKLNLLYFNAFSIYPDEHGMKKMFDGEEKSLYKVR